MQWIPRNSEIFQNYEKSLDYFGEFDQTVFLIIGNVNGDNLLTPENMNIIYDIWKQASNNVTTTLYNKEWTYDDLCARSYPGYPLCESDESGFFQFFGFNPNYWITQESIQAILNAYGSVMEVYITYICSFSLFFFFLASCCVCNYIFAVL